MVLIYLFGFIFGWLLIQEGVYAHRNSNSGKCDDDSDDDFFAHIILSLSLRLTYDIYCVVVLVENRCLIERDSIIRLRCRVANQNLVTFEPT